MNLSSKGHGNLESNKWTASESKNKVDYKLHQVMLTKRSKKGKNFMQFSKSNSKKKFCTLAWEIAIANLALTNSCVWIRENVKWFLRKKIREKQTEWIFADI